jgi:hypothetical protein
LWAARSSAKASTVSALRPSVTKQHATLVDIDEQRDVVVAAPGGCFVDGDALYMRVVGPLAGLLDPMVHPSAPGCQRATHRAGKLRKYNY